MTSPAVGTGIVAFIEAQFKRREETAHKVLDVFGSFAARMMAEWVLAGVAKDRAILALHSPGDHPLNDRMRIPGVDKIYGQVCDGCSNVGGDPYEGQVDYPCQTVRLLAAIDADHPTYDPDWKPVAG